MVSQHYAFCRALLCLACSWVIFGSAGAAVMYTVQDLGGVGGTTYMYAYGINQRGQVTGVDQISGAPNRAYVWDSGVLTPLPVLGGGAGGQRLNDVGQVVGYSYVSVTSSERHACLWDNGVLQDLNTTGGPKLVQASDINNAGQVTVVGSTGGYIWQGGTLAQIGLEIPYAINQVGQIVGGKHTGQLDANWLPIDEAAMWDHGTLTKLGSLGGVRSIARDINDSGQIVGDADTGSATHAFLWENGTMRELPVPISSVRPSVASAINDLGQVVGRMYPSGGSIRAFVYSGGIVTDLNDLISANSGWVLQSAEDINDGGQIVGVGYYRGAYRGYVLTPVPEPATILLLAACACACIRRRNSC